MTKQKQELTHLAALYGGRVEILQTPRGGYRVAVDGGEPEEWLRVTAISGTVPKQDQLAPWAARMAVTHVRRYLETNTGPFTAEQLDLVLQEAQTAHRKKADDAANYGSLVHAYAETFGKAKITDTPLPELPKDEAEPVIKGITAFLDWVNMHNVVFLETERQVASLEYQYVGTLDAIAEVDGVRKLIDYKTSSGIYDEAWLQVALYYHAFVEEYAYMNEDNLAIVEKNLPKGRLILNFSKETGEFTAHEEPPNRLQKDIDTAIGMVPLRRWLDDRRKEYEVNKRI